MYLDRYQMGKFNYIPADPDERDLVYQKPDVPKLKDAEVSVFQLPVGRIESQGNHGSCTCFSLTNAFENLVAVTTGDTTFQASALFNYSQSRILDSDQLTDDPGTTLRSACGNLRLTGIPRDVTWPYTDANFTVSPSAEAYAEAYQLAKMITYFEVKRDLATMKYVLGRLKLFVSIGFLVYPSYQTIQVAETGDIPMPTQAELTNGNIGGHACVIIGYDDNRQVYIIVNNYGTSWGNGGKGTIPYAYFEDPDLLSEAKLMLASDDFEVKYSKFIQSVTTTTNSNTTGTINSQDKVNPKSTTFIWRILIVILVALFFIGTFVTWDYTTRINVQIPWRKDISMR
jgi:C1A family cysteine protease